MAWRSGEQQVGGQLWSHPRASGKSRQRAGLPTDLMAIWPRSPYHRGGRNEHLLYHQNKTSWKPELITAPLDRGDILPGITRISILELARNGRAGDIDVSERDLPMAEVVEAAKDGRLMESFGAGTAAIISPVNCISYKGEDINVPTGDGIGPIAKQFWTILTDIQYGKVEHEWSVVV